MQVRHVPAAAAGKQGQYCSCAAAMRKPAVLCGNAVQKGVGRRETGGQAAAALRGTEWRMEPGLWLRASELPKAEIFVEPLPTVTQARSPSFGELQGSRWPLQVKFDYGDAGNEPRLVDGCMIPGGQRSGKPL